MTNEIGKRWKFDTFRKEIYFVRPSAKIFKSKTWFVGRDKVRELYKYINGYFSRPENMKHLFPMRGDGLRKPALIPNIYKLDGGWMIKKGSEKHLKDGPLLSENGKIILVREKWLPTLKNMTATFIKFIEIIHKILQYLPDKQK